MSQDKAGNELRVGDEVVVRCIIKTIHSGDPDFINCELETIEPIHPETYHQILWVNSRQVEKASSSGHTSYGTLAGGVDHIKCQELSHE